MITPRRLLAVLLLAALAPITQAQPATWPGLDGQAVEAEFLGRKGDYVSFKRTDGSRYVYPYAKLSAADRARVDALTTKTDAPHASDAPAPPAATPAAPAPAGKLASALAGNLVTVTKGKLAPVPASKTEGARFVALYYSAKWCPPCRAFTPELVKTYQQIKAKHPEFELVFVSSDQNPAAMIDYMTSYGMNFPAVDFAKRNRISALQRPAHENGIPNLVFMNADGRELSLSFSPSGDYLGPQKVLADIRRHFKM